MKLKATLVLLATLTFASGVLANDCGNDKDKGKGSPSCNGNSGNGGAGGSSSNVITNQAIGQGGNSSSNSTAVGIGGQGGNASSGSYSGVSDSGNSSSTASQSQGQKQSQTQSASANNAQANSQSSSVNIENPRNAPSAPVVFAPSAPCRVGYGASASWLSGSLGFGASKADVGCERRELARSFLAAGERTAAIEVLCADKNAKNVTICRDLADKKAEEDPNREPPAIPAVQ